VDHAVALLDRGAPDPLSEMALPGARRPEEQHVFAPGDEARGGELVVRCHEKACAYSGRLFGAMAGDGIVARWSVTLCAKFER
jgi:hypothetical protein